MNMSVSHMVGDHEYYSNDSHDQPEDQQEEEKNNEEQEDDDDNDYGIPANTSSDVHPDTIEPHIGHKAELCKLNDLY